MGVQSALVAGSLAGGQVEREMAVKFVLVLMRGAPCKSPSDQGAGAQRRLAPEAVWCGRGDGLWRRKVWETTGSQTPTKTGACALGRRPPGPGPGRPKGSERGTDGRAGYDGEREQALSYELRYLATTLMRGENRHSLWRAAWILGGGVCCRTDLR